MKIAVFHNLSTGGAKRALYNNIKFLHNTGHEVDVFIPSTANEEYLPLKNTINEIKIFPVKNTAKGFFYSALKYHPSINNSLIDLEKTHSLIASEINKGEYDILICEQDVYTLSPFILKYVKIPHLYYCQQPPFVRHNITKKLSENTLIKENNFFKNKIFMNYYIRSMRKIDKNNMLNARYVTANSYFSRETILREYGINSYVSYLGVDNTIFKSLEIPRENFVLSVGECRPEKGYDFIINALSKIDAEIRPYLIIVSNRHNLQWKSYINNLARVKGVKLKILNLISDEKLVLLYNKAKIVVYSPYLEPFGLVPLEAMSCGTPVVAVKEGGVRETVEHKKTGLLTERDPVMFRDAILKLILDPKKNEKMSNKSIKSIEKFWTLEKAGKRMLNHLNRAINCWSEL